MAHLLTFRQCQQIIINNAKFGDCIVHRLFADLKIFKEPL